MQNSGMRSGVSTFVHAAGVTAVDRPARPWKSRFLFGRRRSGPRRSRSRHHIRQQVLDPGEPPLELVSLQRTSAHGSSAAKSLRRVHKGVKQGYSSLLTYLGSSVIQASARFRRGHQPGEARSVWEVQSTRDGVQYGCLKTAGLSLYTWGLERRPVGGRERHRWNIRRQCDVLDAKGGYEDFLVTSRSNVALDNLQIKENALSELDVPFKVKAGQIGIKYDAEKEEKSLQDIKQKELSRIEEALQKAAEKAIDDLMTPEEKDKLFTAIGYSESTHNLTLPKQIIGLGTQVSQRPGAQALKVEAKLEHWYITGLRQQDIVPSLVASIGDIASSLLKIDFETNPENSAADQTLVVQSQPVEVIYDAKTINAVVEFFQSNKGLDLEQITSATLMKLEEIKEKTATVPQTGFHHEKSDLIILDFGTFRPMDIHVELAKAMVEKDFRMARTKDLLGTPLLLDGVESESDDEYFDAEDGGDTQTSISMKGSQLKKVAEAPNEELINLLLKFEIKEKISLDYHEIQVIASSKDSDIIHFRLFAKLNAFSVIVCDEKNNIAEIKIQELELILLEHSESKFSNTETTGNNFLNNFRTAKEALSAATAQAAEKAATSVKDLAQRSFRVSVNIDLKAPVIVIPQSSTSTNAVVVDLGLIRVQNQFSLIPSEDYSHPPVIDKMDVQLTKLKLSRTVIQSGTSHPDIQLLHPINLEFSVNRNLAASWYRKVPVVEIKGHLESMNVNLNQEDLNLLFRILAENLGEATEDLDKVKPRIQEMGEIKEPLEISTLKQDVPVSQDALTAGVEEIRSVDIINMLLKFEIKEVVITLMEKAEKKGRPLHELSVLQLGMEARVKAYDLTAEAYLKKISMRCFEFSVSSSTSQDDVFDLKIIAELNAFNIFVCDQKCNIADIRIHVIDTMSIQLTQLKLSRTILQSGLPQHDIEILKPVNMLLSIQRNLAATWYVQIPGMEIKGKLKPMQVALSRDDLTVLMKILLENLGEASSQPSPTQPTQEVVKVRKDVSSGLDHLKGKMFKDGSMNVNLKLKTCTLDDLREGIERATSRFVISELAVHYVRMIDKKNGQDNSSMIDINYKQGKNGSHIDAVLDKLYVCASVEFLMTVADFFIKAVPQSPENLAKESQIPLRQTAMPKIKMEKDDSVRPNMTLKAKITDPEVVFVANLTKADAPALTASFQCNLSLSASQLEQKMEASVRDLKVLACPFLREKRGKNITTNWTSLMAAAADMTLEVKNNPVQDKSLMPGDDFIVIPEPQTEVGISSGDTMNITVSKSSLTVFNNLAKGFSEGAASTFDYSLKDRAPFTVTNSVGVPIKIKNHFSIAFIIYKYVKNVKLLERIGVARPEEEFHVPLDSYRCQLFIQPAGILENQYKESTTYISWKEELHRSKEVRCVLQCPSTEVNFLPLIVNTVALPDELSYICTHGEDWDPAYIIHLYPTVTLRNFLPYALTYLLEGTAETHELAEGSAADVLHSRISGEIMELFLVKYQGKNWRGCFRIHDTLPEFLLVCFSSDSAEALTIDLSVHVKRIGSQMELSVFSPYWLINKTSRVLQYRSEDVHVKHPADFRDIILFSFKKKNIFSKNKVQLKISTSSWSSSFSLDTVGNYGSVKELDPKGYRVVNFECYMEDCYVSPQISMATSIKAKPKFVKAEDSEWQVGVSIKMSSFNLTRIVTLTPFYTIENKSSLELEVGEIASDGSVPTNKWNYIASSEYLPFWPEKFSGKLCVRVVGYEGFSRPFFYNQQDNGTLLSLEDLNGGILVDVDIAQHSTVISFSDYHEGCAPALIINHTPWDVLTYKQRGLQEEMVLLPRQVRLFAWADPTGTRKLTWTYAANTGEHDLLKDECGQFPYDANIQIHWVSFLDGRQRVLLFTDDVALVSRALQAEEAEQARHEVTLSLHSLGLSLVNNEDKQEVSYVGITSQLPGTVFPVVFHPVAPPKSIALDSEPKPFIDVSVITRFNEYSKVLQFKYFMVLIQEMALKVDQGFLGAITALFTPTTDPEAKRKRTELIQEDSAALNTELVEPSVTDTSVLSFFELFHISPIKLHLSLSLGSGGGESDKEKQEIIPIYSVNLLLKSIGATLTDVDDLIFKLAYYEIRCQFYNRDQLMWSVVRHYSEQFLKQMYVLVLGLDVLGNPFGLIRGGAAGVVSRITGSVGKGLAAITMDKEYQQKRREEMGRQPKDFGDSLARGGKGFLRGVVGGVTGIITKPVEGAKKEGAAGFFKGIGKGLVGAVARPTGGIIDMASSTFQGIQSLIETFDKFSRVAESTEEVSRLRSPRLIHEDGIIRPYNRQESEGYDLFEKQGLFHKKDSANQGYVQKIYLQDTITAEFCLPPLRAPPGSSDHKSEGSPSTGLSNRKNGLTMGQNKTLNDLPKILCSQLPRRRASALTDLSTNQARPVSLLVVFARTTLPGECDGWPAVVDGEERLGFTSKMLLFRDVITLCGPSCTEMSTGLQWEDLGQESRLQSQGAKWSSWEFVRSDMDFTFINLLKREQKDLCFQNADVGAKVGTRGERNTELPFGALGGLRRHVMAATRKGYVVTDELRDEPIALANWARGEGPLTWADAGPAGCRGCSHDRDVSLTYKAHTGLAWLEELFSKVHEVPLEEGPGS
ncbi:hypothetical protein CB1_000715056 [Camelus ferus]|nr:hypothetical protein CB1_000715056 [Camelus ferus]